MQPYLAMIRARQGRGFTVEYPDLPGCAAAVASFPEARGIAGRLLARHLQTLHSTGAPIPVPRSMKELQDQGLAENAVPMLVSVPVEALPATGGSAPF